MNIYKVITKNPYNNIVIAKSEEEYDIDDYVIIKSEKESLYTKIVNKDLVYHGDIEYEIERKATEEDYNQYLEDLKLAKEAIKNCEEIAKKLKLDMNIISSYINFDHSQLIINFTSLERIDFRELAKRLAFIYKTRIELRQIGPRDKAKEVGGLGICGHVLCCKKFLNKMDNITINMAKNQNLALNPNKINGACGRLFCCLEYEDKEYIRCSKYLPEVGDIINTEFGECEVIGVDILKQLVTVLVNGDKKVIDYHDREE